MSLSPVAFMSYVRDDDAHENGRLSQFCARLSGEIKMQGGEAFPIFQDRNDIQWGQQWQQRIEESLDAVTFLIPILTPSFFKSPPCRKELERFLEREQKLGRGDLILPLYYVDCPLLNDEAKRAGDALAVVLAGRNYTDWRELRFELLTAPHVGRTLAGMAKQVIAAMERGQAAPIKPKEQTHPAPDAAALAERSAKIIQTGPQSKYEPPTRIVDAMHRGDHATITEALEAAQPGDRILVRPGLYREYLYIDKPVEIIGDGEPGAVVIESEKDNNYTIFFCANMGRIANLTIRQTQQVGDAHGLVIVQGRLDVEDCDISSTGYGVFVLDGAAPRLQRNHIHNCEFGVTFADNSLGSFEDNQISSNDYAVVVNNGSHPTFRRNVITGNRITAVWVYGGGHGTFEDNDLRGNPGATWHVDPDCLNKVVRRNNFEDK